MATLIPILLFLHIISGIICFVSGLISITTKKGGKAHTFSGKTYFFAMFSVIVTAVIISIFRSNLFLLLIASFSFYMTWAGVRSIRNKTLKPSIFDWIFFATGVSTAVVMIMTLNVILISFGILFSIGLIQELFLFIRAKKKTTKPNEWIVRHIGMMLGSYIATTTAFLVTNVQSFDPQWLPWLAPTILGSPIIAYYTRKYAKKA